MKFKVCGLTQLEQVHQIADLGVAYAGFIFYNKSARYVYNHLSCEELKSITGIKKIGVFVNASQEEILKTIYECGVTIVQLHGDETPNFCEGISNHVKVVKAFRIEDEDHFKYRINSYTDACDMFLFDTAGAGYGGTGKKFNWEILKDLNVNKPFLLSGGIQPEDTDAIKEFSKSPVAKDLHAVDINSGFEISPGVKDIEKVSAFVKSFMKEPSKSP